MAESLHLNESVSFGMKAVSASKFVGQFECHPYLL